MVESDFSNKRKSHGMKKKKTLFTSEQLEAFKKLTTLTAFPVSVSLLNLLRNPKIEDHEFD